MKKLLAILGGVLIVVALYVLLKPEGKVTNFPPEGETIVMFGDSLVAGVGANKDASLTAILGAKIDQEVLNMGVPGDTTEEALKRLSGVLDADPKVVMILLGGNDFLRKIPMTQTFENIDAMVGQIQETGAVVILLGIRGGVLSDPYANEFERIAKSRGTLYVSDVLDGVIGNTKLMSDTVHPNALGYQKIAERIYPVLKQSYK